MAFDPGFSEADTIRELITPRLRGAGWDKPYSLAEQRTITDGRITTIAGKAKRGEPKRVDYLLRYSPDVSIAVVEAKKVYATAADGLQQAKAYAQMLGLQFAYASNGQELIEHDFLTGLQRTLKAFPSPVELWHRLTQGQHLGGKTERVLLEPSCRVEGKQPRYYQQIAINRALTALTSGQKRVLLTMATGTGKTYVAFQICWKLWSAGWNRQGAHRKPRILFLADRNILVDDPKDRTFTPFGDARFKIEDGQISRGREMYFAIYQAIASREGEPGLYRQLPPDFFDLIVVDECHRGSARDDSNWREILEYFTPAYQLGMTATPQREDNRDTYLYFGNPIYQYSLKQGIDDGFLAPYTVYRVTTDKDALGYRPELDQTDRYGRVIPDQEYHTEDFDRLIVLPERTRAHAKHLTDFLARTGDRFAKTIVFCVDQEHASDMQQALAELNADLMQQFPDYVCRITADEGDIGRGMLDKFKDVETLSPVLVTTSKLLTTGVDVPTCRNIVIARAVNSMTEFKQIIGRGTRVRDDYNKLSFTIIDYTGSATRQFADPEFDGDPALITEEEIDASGKVTATNVTDGVPEDGAEQAEGMSPGTSDQPAEHRKFYADGVPVGVIAEMTYELDASGQQSLVKYTERTAQQVRELFPRSAELREQWANPIARSRIITLLAERGIQFDRLVQFLHQPEADPFDLLCHVAFNAPVRTRRERAERVRLEESAFFQQYAAPAREVLEALLDKYAEYGATQFSVDVLKVAPISQYGTVSEIAARFGGAAELKQAMDELQGLLYAA